jgi:hypothetical protein
MKVETPNEKWSLKKLAEFCRLRLRRTAQDAWHIGQALSIARKKEKDERNWLRWLAEELDGLSKSSAYRYIDIFRKRSLEEVKGRALSEVHKSLAPTKREDVPPGRPVAAEPEQDGAKTPSFKVHRPEPKTRPSQRSKEPPAGQQYSWAVPDPAAVDSFASLVSECDGLAESLSSAIEHQDWKEWNAKQRAKVSEKSKVVRILLSQLEQALTQKESA